LVSKGDIFTTFCYKFINNCLQIDILDLSLITLLQYQQGCTFYAPQCSTYSLLLITRGYVFDCSPRTVQGQFTTRSNISETVKIDAEKAV